MTLDDYLSSKGYTLTQEQYDYCYDVIYGNTHVANFSVAGSGKSLCLEIIKGFLGDQCVVCATSGIANSILFDNQGGNGTAHKVFSLPLTIATESNIKKVKDTTTKLFASSDLVKVVIVEESGMLNPDQLMVIQKRLERFNRPIKGKRKKRNIKLVLQGDFLQIGAVMSDEEIEYMRNTYGSEQLFESSPFLEMNFSKHIFSKVLRTTDKTFQACLDVIRYGQVHRYEKCLQWINKRYKPAPPNIPFITTTNKKVQEANNRLLKENPNQAFTFYAHTKGRYDIKNCPAEEVITLKKDCPVISLMNCKEGNYFNGSFGYVTMVVPSEGVWVKFVASGEEHFVPLFEYEEREYFTDKSDGQEFMNSKVVGTCVQLPIKMAAAFSIHRMQGRTLDTPFVVDLGKWGFNQSQDNPWGMALAYVALSRSTSVENIYLEEKLTPKHIKVNRKAVEWVVSNKKVK